MQKEAFEPTGLIPRSIIRTVDRFLQQLLPGSESVAIQEYRVSRYQILVSIQSLLILVCIPFAVQYAIKSFLLMPLTEHFWNSQQKEIFLNSYQEKRAFDEMKDFSEKIFFEALLKDSTSDTNNSTINTEGHAQSQSTILLNQGRAASYEGWGGFPSSLQHQRKDKCALRTPYVAIQDDNELPPFLKKGVKIEEQKLQRLYQSKSLQVACKYNQQSIKAITNTCADLVSLCTIYVLSVFMKAQIIILKSFCIESIYSLSDTTKSFLLILVMDLLVGFHSPRGWEIALETLLQHFGLPENENFVLLFVALFPVFLDTVFKYWIFRYLNKISPSTVVTYHSMIE